MNLVLLLAHSIEEFDQVKLLTGLGYDVFSPGAYETPNQPGDDKRPAIPEASDHPELREACWRVRHAHREDPLDRVIDWAKFELPDEVIDWGDVFIVHHLEHTWIPNNWPRLRGKRVIWRTVGQSVEENERRMAFYRSQGLQIVRYSPKEANIPGYAGADALIRFYKDPDEWYGWTGEDAVVGNITQNFKERWQFCNYDFWCEATDGLPTRPAGPGSQELPNGLGPLPYDEMRAYLRRTRAYLYTGTQPASYTLGLLEALMTGTPVVSIGPSWMQVFPFGPDIFEGHELATRAFDSIGSTRQVLEALMEPATAEAYSRHQRARAISLFGKDVIGAQWKAFLG